jgi:hypothetical protein
MYNDSSSGTATRLRAGDRGSRVRFPTGTGNFSLHHSVKNGSGSHPTAYSMGTGGSSLGVKRPGREADHLPPSSAEVITYLLTYLLTYSKVQDIP